MWNSSIVFKNVSAYPRAFKKRKRGSKRLAATAAFRKLPGVGSGRRPLWGPSCREAVCARGLGLPCTRGPHPSVDLRGTACVYLRLTATAISAGNSRSEIFKILLDFKVRGTAPSVRLLKIERPWQGTESRPARLNRMQCVLEAQRVHVHSRKREPGLEANAAGLTSCAE